MHCPCDRTSLSQSRGLALGAVTCLARIVPANLVPALCQKVASNVSQGQGMFSNIRHGLTARPKPQSIIGFPQRYHSLLKLYIYLYLYYNCLICILKCTSPNQSRGLALGAAT